MRLSAKFKLLLLVIGSLTVMGLFSIVAFVASSTSITNKFVELDEFSSLNASYRMNIMQQVAQLANLLQITYRQSDPDLIDANLQLMDKEEGEIQKTMDSCGDLCNELRAPIAQMKVLKKSAIDAFLVGDTAKALEITLRDITKQYDQIYTILDKIAVETQKIIEQKKADIASSNHNNLIMTILAIIIGLLVTSVLSIYVVNRLIGTIQKLMQDLTATMHSVSENSEQISQASASLSESSATQAASVEETASSLEEFSQMLANNVSRSESSKKQTATMDNSIQKASQLMQQMKKAMEQIVASNQQINHLVTLIGDINTKTSVVDEIVFQTKLLSFNASVEAERAGEHGRGFAVVAQEVGSLAQMSGNAASEIAHIVGESIQQADQIAKDNLDKAQAGKKNVEGSVNLLEEIASNSKLLLNDVEEILKATAEQSLGIKQINQAIASIEQATSSNSEVASQTESISKQLKEEMEGLNSILAQLNEVVLGK